jgi:CheY-like chemotaxis protein
LAQIRQQRPDVILLDLAMPGMGGLGFLEMLRSTEALKTVPVVIITAAEYSADMLTPHSSRISLDRHHVFGPSEVIRYVQAMLDLTEAEYPDDDGRVL